jgi:hypothetical protein
MLGKSITKTLLSTLVIGVMSTPTPVLAYGGTAWGPIAMLTIYRGSERKGALIQPSAAFTNNDNCPVTTHLFIDFSTAETPDGKSLYAMALAAKMADKPVSIGTHGCSSEGYPLVYGINVQ